MRSCWERRCRSYCDPDPRGACALRRYCSFQSQWAFLRTVSLRLLLGGDGDSSVVCGARDIDTPSPMDCPSWNHLGMFHLDIDLNGIWRTLCFSHGRDSTWAPASDVCHSSRLPLPIGSNIHNLISDELRGFASAKLVVRAMEPFYCKLPLQYLWAVHEFAVLIHAYWIRPRWNIHPFLGDHSTSCSRSHCSSFLGSDAQS